MYQFMGCFLVPFMVLSLFSPKIIPLQSKAELASSFYDTQEIPYVYYYSTSQSAIIIERADGNDTRVLLSLPGTEAITGPGWSPSGRWLAFSSGALHTDTRKSLVINRGGDVQYPLLEQNRNISQMIWSPVHDFLLVVTHEEISSEVGTISKPSGVYVIDVEHQTIIASFSNPHAIYDDGDIFWTPDGRFVVIYYSFISDKANNYRMALISSSGNTKIHSFFQKENYCMLPQWSNNSWFSYIDENNEFLVLENLSNNNLRKVRLPAQTLRAIHWSPDNTYGLIYTAETCGTSIFHLWLLSLAENTVYPIFNETIYEPSFDPIKKTPYQEWSPDGKRALIVSTTGYPYVIDVHTREAQAVPITLSNWTGSAKWSSSGNKVTFAGVSSEGSAIYSYTVTTQEVERLDVPAETIQIRYFDFSENEQYLAYSWGCFELCIVNTSTRQVVKVSSLHEQVDSTIFAGIYEVLWHPDKNWLLTLGYLEHLRVVNVTNVDGSVQRELTICNLSQSCFGWLPNVAN